MMVTIINYDRGSIIIYGEVRTPYGIWDSRINAFRAIAMHYSDILEYLKRSNLKYIDNVQKILPIQNLTCNKKLRSYQNNALKAWLDAGRKGVIELPTGSGKTYVAIKAIEKICVPTLIIVPTIDLLDQWRSVISKSFEIETGTIGTIGGGENIIKSITVSTYDSAYLRGEILGNKFLFLIFDEVHHLPSPNYSLIAEMYIAPYRMGLTATYKREDGKHEDLKRLVGGIVYQIGIDKLSGKYLSPYIHKKIFVILTNEEREIYEEEYKIFKTYLIKKNIHLNNPKDFQRFIMISGKDPEARKALLARNKALKIALNSESKIKILASLLKDYPNEKIIIFTLHNMLVNSISKTFLIPAIIHKTTKEERKDILQEFRDGNYRILVTSQVLDEGIDVPDASMGIILSGTGSSREYIQRLGRILRKVEGKKAKLIEIVTRNTVETRISSRRLR